MNRGRGEGNGNFWPCRRADHEFRQGALRRNTFLGGQESVNGLGRARIKFRRRQAVAILVPLTIVATLLGAYAISARLTETITYRVIPGGGSEGQFEVLLPVLVAHSVPSRIFSMLRVSVGEATMSTFASTQGTFLRVTGNGNITIVGDRSENYAFTGIQENPRTLEWSTREVSPPGNGTNEVTLTGNATSPHGTALALSVTIQYSATFSDCTRTGSFSGLILSDGLPSKLHGEEFEMCR